MASASKDEIAAAVVPVVAAATEQFFSKSQRHHGEGEFKNIYDTWSEATLGKVLKWVTTRKREPMPKNLDEVLPVLKTLPTSSNLPQDCVQVTWVGHASVLVQMEGMSFMTDPIFSKRCSPFQFIGPARFRPAPFSISELPTLHFVMISHNHYDHLDANSVDALFKRFGDGLQWFVPLNVAAWFHDRGITNVVELDWWQESPVANSTGLRIAATPCQHWSGRFPPRDRRKTLWCSWAVLGRNTRFYFGGDTGYCPVFKEIGATYGPFTLAALPIGAYCPRDFMRPQHVDPEEAVLIHKDIGAQHSIGVHWGTFVLTDEPVLQPPQLLRQCADKHGLQRDEFFTLRHGGECCVRHRSSAAAQPALASADEASTAEDVEDVREAVARL